MIWLTGSERRALAALGLTGLAALGVLAWQGRRPPLAILGAPTANTAARWDRALDAARRLDVNTAGAEALERLPQVGPSLAQRIIEERRLHGRFRAPEELMRVKGIGPKTVDALREHVSGEE